MKLFHQIIFLGKGITSLIFNPLGGSGWLEMGSKRQCLIIICGFNQSAGSWSEVAKKLSINFKVIVIELPNRGRSKNNVDDISRYCSYTVNFLKTNKIYHPIILGHSLGGKVAAKIVYQNPNIAKRLILYGVGGVEAPLGFEDKFWNIIKVFFFGAASKMNYTNIYSSIKTPTLLVYGAYDIVNPPTIGKVINNLISKSELVIIPNTSHVAHIEKPSLFSSEVERFLGPEKN